MGDKIRGSLASFAKLLNEMFRRGEVTSLSGPIWVGLGSRGGGMSDVVQISMKNYHITASNSALESPSAAKFNALTFRVIEMFRRGGGDVTLRTHLGRSWV